MSPLTHFDDSGNAHMVDVGDKPITRRKATAEGWLQLSDTSFKAVIEGNSKKGDVLYTAQLAGIQAAKRTADMIPLCHPIPLSSVQVTLETDTESQRVHCLATVCADWKTGVEMEALNCISAALLTVYDMLKAVDRGMSIGPIRLLEKQGGRSGHWQRAPHVD